MTTWLLQTLETELVSLKQQSSDSSQGAHAQLLEIEKQLQARTQELEETRKQLQDKLQESQVRRLTAAAAVVSVLRRAMSRSEDGIVPVHAGAVELTIFLSLSEENKTGKNKVLR